MSCLKPKTLQHLNRSIEAASVSWFMRARIGCRCVMGAWGCWRVDFECKSRGLGGLERVSEWLTVEFGRGC